MTLLLLLLLLVAAVSIASSEEEPAHASSLVVTRKLSPDEDDEPSKWHPEKPQAGYVQCEDYSNQASSTGGSGGNNRQR